MVDDNTNKIINELLMQLKQKYSDFKGIYLFGSRARGDFNEYSDYDLAIIFKREVDSQLKREISGIIAMMMLEHQVIIDNPVFSYKNILDPNMPIIDNILKDGIFYE